MEEAGSPSLIDRIGTPLFLLLLGGCSMAWFVFEVYAMFSHGLSPIITFYKGACYMLGVSIASLTFTFMIVKEFWFLRPLTKRQNTIYSRVVISGVVLMFLFPHLMHYAADRYFTGHGYTVCEDASRQWLFMRDIVYIDKTVECSSSLNKK